MFLILGFFLHTCISVATNSKTRLRRSSRIHHSPSTTDFQVPIFLHYFLARLILKTARTENQSEDFCNRLQPTLNHWSRRWRLWPFGAALQGALAAQSSGSCAERQGLTLALRCACACSRRLNF